MQKSLTFFIKVGEVKDGVVSLDTSYTGITKSSQSSFKVKEGDTIQVLIKLDVKGE